MNAAYEALDETPQPHHVSSYFQVLADWCLSSLMERGDGPMEV